MMQAIEGIYQNGHIKLLETPKSIRRSRVVVTFLDDEEKHLEEQTTMLGTIEILDEDLEAASREISQLFHDAIEKSGKEVQQ